MSSTPAGWYQDPSGTHHLRYWDGSAWTHYASTGGQQVVSPISSDTAPPTVWTPDQPTEPVRAVSPTSPPGPPFAPLPTADTVTDEVVHHRRKWPFVIGAVAVLLGIGVVIAVLAGGHDKTESVAASPTTVDDCATAPDPAACRNSG